MCRGLTVLWSAFGVVGILTIALLNTSCCSQRKAVSESRTEATEQMTSTAHSESRSEEQHAATLTTETERRGLTVTEIEIYDTEQPADSTGAHPVKARIRQTQGEESQSRATLEESGTSSVEETGEAAQTYEGGTLDEVTVTAERSPSLWERIKQGTVWAVAIMILTAAGWIVYNYKKSKTT